MSSPVDVVALQLLSERRIDGYLYSLGVWTLSDETIAELLARLVRVLESRRPGLSAKVLGGGASGTLPR